MTDFLYLGGYGFYVWTAYGGAVLVIAWEIFSVKRRLRAAIDATRGMNRKQTD